MEERKKRYEDKNEVRVRLAEIVIRRLRAAIRLSRWRLTRHYRGPRGKDYGYRSNRPCQASFHVLPKDSLISRLTLEVPPGRLPSERMPEAPFQPNKRSDDSDLA